MTKSFTERLQELIKTSNGEIIHGGKVDTSDRYVEPTIIVNPDKDSRLMKEEIFGPILPVYTY